MKQLKCPWRGLLARVLVFTLAVGAVPAYCLAGETPPPAQSAPTLAAAIQKAVAMESGKVEKASHTLAKQESGGTDLSSKSFFKSPAGIVTLVAIAAGVGFALYSTSHDRVKSPNVAYGGTK